MTKEDFQKFVVDEAHVVALVEGTDKGPQLGRGRVLWKRGQEEEWDPVAAMESRTWVQLSLADCMLPRLDRWLSERRLQERR